MKKFLIALSACVLLSGCGSNSLECDISENYLGNIPVKENYVIKFDGKEIEHIDYKQEMTVSDDYSEDEKEELRDSYAVLFEFIESSNMKVDSKVKKNKIYLDVDSNYKELSDVEKNVFEKIDSKMDRKELKKHLEKDGYTCK